MTTTPAENTVAAALATLGYGTVGTSIKIGPETPVDATLSPDVCVFVLDTGGAAPMGFCDGAINADYESNTQIVFRGKPNTYTTTRGLAESALHDLNEYTLTGYWRCVASQSAPTYLGRNETGHERFSFNARVTRTVA